MDFKKYLKLKYVFFVDSVFISLVNLSITFVYVSFGWESNLADYGIYLTLALVLQSFQRTMLLVPFNVGGDDVDVSKFYYSNFLMALIFSLFFIIAFDWYSVVVFLFYFFHEMLRFLVRKYSGFYFFVFNYIFVVFLWFLYFLFYEFDYYSIYFLFLSFFVADFVLLMCVFLFSGGRLFGVKLSSLAFGFSFDSIILSFFQSLFIHLPIIILYFSNKWLMAVALVFRSFYQVVQIMIKSNQIVDQGEIKDFYSSSFYYDFIVISIRRYLLVSVFLFFVSMMWVIYFKHVYIDFAFISLAWFFVYMLMSYYRFCENLFFYKKEVSSLCFVYICVLPFFILLLFLFSYFELYFFYFLSVVFSWFFLSVLSTRKLRGFYVK